MPGSGQSSNQWLFSHFQSSHKIQTQNRFKKHISQTWESRKKCRWRLVKIKLSAADKKLVFTKKKKNSFLKIQKIEIFLVKTISSPLKPSLYYSLSAGGSAGTEFVCVTIKILDHNQDDRKAVSTTPTPWHKDNW